MRIHKVIQENLEQNAEEKRVQEFISEKEKELKELMKASNLLRIVFKRGWWIFSTHYRVTLDSIGGLDYYSSPQYLDKNIHWDWCGYQDNKYEILSYLMT